jgi:eukaryotic-like serine/threonine-protein kinase
MMDANGGSPRKVLQAAPGEHILQLQWSPDGQRVAYTKSNAETQKPDLAIEIVSAEGGVPATLFAAPGLRSFCWPDDSRIVYSAEEPPPRTDMNLWEISLDRSSSKVSGQPRRITNWAGVSLLDLSVSADSKRLVFVNSGLQRELYVAENPEKRKLETPRRLTLEGRNDLPSAWTLDGQSLFFYSDRNGNWDIFKQRLEQRTAEDFIVGPGEQTQPRLTPDGSSVLYWDYKDPIGGALESMRLIRVPISGGAPEQVLESSPNAEIRCARTHSRCILGERDRIKNELVFTDIDPVRGKAVQLLSLGVDPAASPEWDLSPDGMTVAIVNLDDAKDRIRLVQLDSKAARSISLGHAKTLSGISWSADGKSWFVTSSSVRGASILNVQSNGASSELWATPNIVGTPLTSPDDKNLAFTVSTRNSNAWLIENF